MQNGEGWLMDPATRDYQIDGGSPVVDTSLKMPIYFRTMIPRTRWMYAPNPKYGSDFWAYRDRLSQSSGAIAEAIETRALQPLIEDGRAVSIDVAVDTVERAGITLDVKALDAAGQQSRLPNLVPVPL